MVIEPRTRAFVARRTGEGRSKREISRMVIRVNYFCRLGVNYFCRSDFLTV